MVDVKEFILLVIQCSERAAVIAREIHKQKRLLSLLVEEKQGESKNVKFKHDFKTLADVLIQEVVRYYLSQRYPEMKHNIKGEETSKFTNPLGETVDLQLSDSQKATTNALYKILNKDMESSKTLSELAHNAKLELKIDNLDLEQLEGTVIDVHDIGIWIDPLDGTAMFIDGNYGEKDQNGIETKGLPCTQVIIGVYSKSTGKPLVGVINCPFPSKDNKNSEIIWGYHTEDKSFTNTKRPIVTAPTSAQETRVIVSKSEKLDRLSQYSDIEFLYASGCGYKIKIVIEGLAAAFLMSPGGGAYYWDTCAAHAILACYGGGIVHLAKFYEQVSIDEAKSIKGKNDNGEYTAEERAELLEKTDITYNGKSDYDHKGGFIAYLDFNTLLQIRGCMLVR